MIDDLTSLQDGSAGGLSDVATAEPAASPTIAEPQSAVQPTTPQQVAQGTAPREDPLKSALNFFRDPKRLGLAAAAAAAARRPDMIHWLKRGYEAQKENAGEALVRLSGGDKAGAAEIFNLNGDMKVDSIEDGSKPGTYIIKMAGGASREVDPKRELMSLLTPPQYFQQTNREDLLAQREEFNKRMNQLGLDRLAMQRDVADAKLGQRQAEFESKASDRDAMRARTEAQIAHLNAQTALAGARAANVGSGGGNGETKYNPQTFSRMLRDEAEKAFSVTDPITNKTKNADPTGTLIVKSMAESINRDQRMSPAEAVSLAKREYERMRASAEERADADVERAKRSAGVEVGSPSTWGNMFKGPDFGKDKTEKDFRDKRVKQYLDESLKTTPNTAGGAVKSPPLTNSKGWKLHTDKNGNQAYVSPDGKRFEEVR